MAKHIIPLLPTHQCYCEPFAGGLGVLLNKPRSKIEVVNDIDSALVTFFRCARFHADELCRELEWLLNSREEFQDAIAQPGQTDIQRSARWFARNALSFGAKGQHFGTGKRSGGSSHASRSNRLQSIQWLNQRLDRVCIEHLDWSTCIERYDSPDTVYFLDPPYIHGSTNLYVSHFQMEDHQRLRQKLERIEGAWVLTYDDCPEIRSLYAGCHFQDQTTQKGIGNNHPTRKQLQQVIITPG